MVNYVYDKADLLHAIRNGADGFTVTLTFLAPSLEGASVEEWLEYATAAVTPLQGTEIIRAALDVKQVRMDVSEVREAAKTEASIAAVKATMGLPAEAIAARVLAEATKAAKGAVAKAKADKLALVARLKAEANAA